MEETTKRHDEVLEQRPTNIPKKRTGLTIFIVLLLLCGLPTLLLSYSFYQNRKQISEQTQSVYNEYHTLSAKVISLMQDANDYKASDAKSKQMLEEITTAAQNLETELATLKEHTAQKPKNVFNNNNTAYEQLSSGITAAKEYVMFSSCTVKNTQYNATIKTIQDNRRTYGIASGDGDYSPEIKRQQKVKDALNTVKGLNNVYLKCVETNTKYVKVINDDTTEINRYLKEFLDPFISALRTGKQSSIQGFMNKVGNKSWLSIGWRLYIDKTGYFTKDIENDKDTLVNLPKEIETMDTDLLAQYQKVK